MLFGWLLAFSSPLSLSGHSGLRTRPTFLPCISNANFIARPFVPSPLAERKAGRPTRSPVVECDDRRSGDPQAPKDGKTEVPSAPIRPRNRSSNGSKKILNRKSIVVFSLPKRVPSPARFLRERAQFTFSKINKKQTSSYARVITFCITIVLGEKFRSKHKSYNVNSPTKN